MQQATHEKSDAYAMFRNAPWWLWLCVASFLVIFGLEVYLAFSGPVFGVSTTFTGGAVLVTGVAPNSPAAAAGLQVGDDAGAIGRDALGGSHTDKLWEVIEVLVPRVQNKVVL